MNVDLGREGRVEGVDHASSPRRRGAVERLNPVGAQPLADHLSEGTTRHRRQLDGIGHMFSLSRRSGCIAEHSRRREVGVSFHAEVRVDLISERPLAKVRSRELARSRS